VWRLWRHCLACAGKELRKPKRRPVIALYEKGAKGALLVVHQDDLIHAAIEAVEAVVNRPDFPFSRVDADTIVKQFRTLANQQ
jgi:hypothetical protein